MTYCKEHKLVPFVIAIGSNVEQTRNIEKAKEKLNALLPTVHYTHALYTKPIDIQSDKFLNLLAWGETDISLSEIEKYIKEIEMHCGSVKEQKQQGIVALDLDILLFDKMRLHEKDWKREYIQILMNEIPF